MTLYELSDADAVVAFEAIAARKILLSCECEYDVGLTCDRGKASLRRMSRDDDEGVAEERRWRERIERYGELLKRKAMPQWLDGPTVDGWRFVDGHEPPKFVFFRGEWKYATDEYGFNEFPLGNRRVSPCLARPQ